MAGSPGPACLYHLRGPNTDSGSLVLRLLTFWLVLLAGGAQANDERVVRLAASEWPPYAGATQPQSGTVSDTLRRAYAAVGYRVQIDFVPRARLSSAATLPRDRAGYFPQVYATAHDRKWLLSEPVGASPLGFAQHTDRPVAWTTLDDLEPYRIGYLHNVVGSEPLDLRLELGTLRGEPQSDEVALLARLAAGKLDLVSLDSLTFAHLMGNDPRLAAHRGTLVMNPRLVEQRSLHVAFRRNAEGRRLSNLLAEGLRRIGYTTPTITAPGR